MWVAGKQPAWAGSTVLMSQKEIALVPIFNKCHKWFDRLNTFSNPKTTKNNQKPCGTESTTYCQAKNHVFPPTASQSHNCMVTRLTLGFWLIHAFIHLGNLQPLQHFVLLVLAHACLFFTGICGFFDFDWFTLHVGQTSFFPRASERRVLPIVGVCKTS
jgi:hypothetical protein